MAFSRVLALRLGVLWHWHTGGGSLVFPLSCLSQRYSNLSLLWSEMAFSRVLALKSLAQAWCPRCLVYQRYSNLSLLWSEMAFSRVLALRVGVLWHWHTGGRAWCLPLSCSSQRYSNLSLLRSEMAFSRVLALRLGVLWHWHTGGGSLVFPLSCLSQRYSNLSLLWSEMAFSRVLALKVGMLWHWHTGGEPGVPVVLFKSTILQSFTLMVRNGF